MNLADFVPVKEPVVIVKTESPLMVRGLSLDDIAALLHQHIDDLDKLVGLYNQAVNGAEAAVVVSAMSVTLVRDAPFIAAKIIALACDEPGAEMRARQLPLSAQVRAITAILRLTFEDIGGPKKAVESLMNFIGGLGVGPAVTGS